MIRHTSFPFVSICLALAVWILIGCAGRQRQTLDHWPADLPLRATTGEVPFYEQKQYHCGPAALAMVLKWSGVSAHPDQISGKVFTPSQKGSLQAAMVTGTRRSSRLAYEIKGNEALYREIAGGHPVIVLQNLGLSWLPVWHYAVVTGYDITAREMILHTGPSENKRISLALFERTWARSDHWGLLVMPPDLLPATADEPAYVNAALGLEKAGQIRAALTAFQTALQKWPQNFVALMGVGNNYYALGDLPRASDAFEEAALRHPTAGDAFNNLAQVLFELQQLPSAEKAARRAVALGGPHYQIYLQTLKQIQSGGKSP